MSCHTDLKFSLTPLWESVLDRVLEDVQLSVSEHVLLYPVFWIIVKVFQSCAVLSSIPSYSSACLPILSGRRMPTKSTLCEPPKPMKFHSCTFCAWYATSTLRFMLFSEAERAEMERAFRQSIRQWHLLLCCYALHCSWGQVQRWLRRPSVTEYLYF